MKKISQIVWPEIVYSSSNSAESQAIRRAIKANKLRKLATRLYTSNLSDTPTQIIKRNLFHILSHLYPGAILSHKTALEGKPSQEGEVILTYKYTKKLSLAGFTIRLIKGHAAVDGDNPFMGNLFLASRERALLENLQPSRSSKTLPRTLIEEYLDKVCRIYGVEELNRIRDTANRLAKILKLNSEFKILNEMIGSLLGTQESSVLKTQSGIARAKGLPYDNQRIELFATLVKNLNISLLPIEKSSITTTESINNLAFFEAYFSNYIEGTEFEIEEARDILFHNKIILDRSEDSHDISGTFEIISNLSEMRHIPASFSDLINILQSRHALLMSAREDKMPGKFKNKSNRAGNMVFVHPDLVKGTLAKSFDLYQTLKPGIARAIFMMFMIAEIHPFMDGNGRIARIMMNAELEREAECRIIIPTVFREDYLLSLRRLSREGDSDPYIKMLLRAQRFTASLDFSNYDICLKQLESSNAFKEPFEGKLKF